jgi:hypothetical protein
MEAANSETLQFTNLHGVIYQTVLIVTRLAVYCTYNVTVRRVRVTIVAVEKQYTLHVLNVCL